MQLRGSIGLGAAVRKFEVGLQGLLELFRGQAVQVLYHTVVVQDLELPFREADRHEEVVFLVSGVMRVLPALFGAHACSRRGAVMTVGHVESIHLVREDFRDAGNRSVVRNGPEAVAEVVLVDEVVFRLAGRSLGNDGGELRIVFVCEENRFDVGVLDADVHHAVVFLVLAGELVLFDEPGGVIVGMRAKHEAVLGTGSHGLGVDVVALLGVALEPAALLPLGKVFHRTVVHPRVVVFQKRIEVYFRLGDVEQTLLSCHILGFLRVENVVWRSRHLGDNVFGRPDCRKGFYSYHLFTWNLAFPVAKKSTI